MFKEQIELRKAVAEEKAKLYSHNIIQSRIGFWMIWLCNFAFSSAAAFFLASICSLDKVFTEDCELQKDNVNKLETKNQIYEDKHRRANRPAQGAQSSIKPAALVDFFTFQAVHD